MSLRDSVESNKNVWGVFEVSYSLVNGGNYRACVVAHDKKSAVEFLGKRVKVNKIDSISIESRVDAISDSVLRLAIERSSEFAHLLLDTSTEAPEVEKEDIPVQKYICPWCDKEFGSSQGVKQHLTKVHDVCQQMKQENVVEKSEPTLP